MGARELFSCTYDKSCGTIEMLVMKHTEARAFADSKRNPTLGFNSTPNLDVLGCISPSPMYVPCRSSRLFPNYNTIPQS